jgi:hypothetical protein
MPGGFLGRNSKNNRTCSGFWSRSSMTAPNRNDDRLMKIAEAPARQYTYHLTPHGFAEKVRLSLEFLSYSFDLFRRAKADSRAVFLAANERGLQRPVWWRRGSKSW